MGGNYLRLFTLSILLLMIFRFVVYLLTLFCVFLLFPFVLCLCLSVSLYSVGFGALDKDVLELLQLPVEDYLILVLA